MISANLLVVDRSPDSAEHINSLLRNAGISVHVIHADSPAAAKRILDNDDPVLAIHTGGEDEFCALAGLGGGRGRRGRPRKGPSRGGWASRGTSAGSGAGMKSSRTP